MKLGVISDTHDNIKKTIDAVEFFESKGVGKVFHCGDMIAPFTAQLFDGSFEFHAVKGNNDGEWNLKNTVENFGNWHGNIAEFKIENTSICAYHGTDEGIVEGLVGKDYDYVLRGHTHIRKIEKHGDTVELNPGGIKLPGQSEEFHVAVINLEEDKVRHYSLEEF